MARLSLAILLAAALAIGPGPAGAAGAGISNPTASAPAPEKTAETRRGGSSAAPYVLVALGILLALVLVIGSADTSELDVKPGEL